MSIAAFETESELVRFHPRHSLAYTNIGNIYENKLGANLRNIDKANKYYELAKKYM